MKIGIIDFGGIDKNSNSIEAIHNTIERVQLAEQYGFSRYWLTEHYLDGLAWRTAEIILTLIAGFTKNIIVGSAGVVVTLNLPYRVAQDYTLLASLFPNRIDLGFSKGVGTGEVEYSELTMDIIPAEFYGRLLRIKQFIEKQNSGMSITAPRGFLPNMWMLGTSDSSLDFAIENKLNFSLSLFHTVDGDLPSPIIIQEYKKRFFEKNGFEPMANIAIAVFSSNDSQKILDERATRKNVRLNVSGFPEECLQEIKKIKQQYQVEEVIILNLGKDEEERKFLMKVLSKIVLD